MGVVMSRSLSKPWNSDPSPRSIETPRPKMTIPISRSLSHADMGDPKPPRSNAVLKRAFIAKKNKKQNKKKQNKKISKKSAITSITTLTNLEYFNYYLHTPPTPLKTSKGFLYEVDRVLGRIVCECGTVRWLVKWQGYPNTANSCIFFLPEEFRAQWG